MLPIYANCCRGVAIGCVYGFFVAVDNHSISWQESHKKPNKTCFSCGSNSSSSSKKSMHASKLAEICPKVVREPQPIRPC